MMSNGWARALPARPCACAVAGGDATVPARRMDREPLLLVAVLVSFLAGLGVAGCTPSLGDKCSLSTDCSVRGDRVCDTSQPNGYCTLFNCTSNSCPNNAACVEFNASVPGCSYDDYRSPSRTGRTFCMAACGSDSDCRLSDGYVCRDPSSSPWAAVVLDSNPARRVCVVSPTSGAAVSSADAGVCTAAGGSIAEASVAAVDGTAGLEASVDAPGAETALFEAAVEAAQDAFFDAAETSVPAGDGGVDSTDAARDATPDGAADSGVSDAPAGG